MADYLDKNILCQAYIHIDRCHLTPAQADKLGATLKSFAATRAEFFLYTDVDVDISFKDGSIKAYLTVIGILTPLFAGVANYPSFREGAILIYDDVKRLSDYLVAESLFETKAKREEILRIEARTGVVGKLRQLLSDVDAIKEGNGVRPEEWMAKRIEKLGQDIDDLLENLRSEEDKIVVRKGLIDEVSDLPVVPKPAPRQPVDAPHAAAYRNERRSILEALKQPSIPLDPPTHPQSRPR